MPCGDAFVLVQFSDPHIGASWSGDDSVARLSSCVDAALHLPTGVDAVLLTGDLADHSADSEYGIVNELMAQIDAPLYALPGNHDDRRAMRRLFGIAGNGGAPIRYAADVGPLRLILLDSTRPGEVSGELADDQLAWLDDELTGSSHPTMVALHHPPFRTGSEAWDRIGLAARDQNELAALLARHAQVVGIVAGHVHHGIVSEVGGKPALTAPSTYVQAHVEPSSNEIAFGEGSPGFAVHAFADGRLVSQFHYPERSDASPA